MDARTGEGTDASPGRPPREVARERMRSLGDDRGGVDLRTVLRFVDAAVDALGADRAAIDALNVYPVPDGDTGTNMYLTLTSARDALQQALQDALATSGPDAGRSAGGGLAAADGLRAFARGALLGARGNSGVILAEMLGALARHFAAADPALRLSTVVAEGLTAATAACYAAVGDPVEGTMLTVLREAAEAAELRAAHRESRSGEVFAAAATAAREALARTPEQLDVLARAGVVDAGGQGLCVLLEAAEQVVSGKPASRRPAITARPDRADAVEPVDVAPDAAGATVDGEGDQHGHDHDHLHADLSAEGPAYEVMYLVDAADERAPELRTTLLELGDSVVVVGGDGLWNVHVHTDDVGAAIEAGLDVGRPRRIRVTHFAEQIAAAQRDHPAPRGRSVVAVAAGPGLAALFAEAGATVVEASTVRRPSTGEILAAIADSGAEEVIVLPNDEHTVRAAEAAAATAEADATDGHPVRVAVIPTRTQVQGLAALAVHDPETALERDVTEMTATARHVRHGAITIAARNAMTMAGPCQVGDVLGVIAGDFAVVGDDREEVVLEVLRRLLAAGGELVTLVAGEDGGRALAERVEAWVEEHHPHIDVVSYEGGQERYPLLVSVE